MPADTLPSLFNVFKLQSTKKQPLIGATVTTEVASLKGEPASKNSEVPFGSVFTFFPPKLDFSSFLGPFFQIYKKCVILGPI